MCEAFLPLIKSQGRIVNVASVAAHLNGYGKAAESKIRDSAASLDKVDALLSEYEGLLKDGKELDAGFKKSPYCISKAFVLAYTKALAAANSDKFINACCPGWWVMTCFLACDRVGADPACFSRVDTDMGNIIGDAPKTLEQGGKIPVRCAVGDIQGATGEFWENKSVTDTGDGAISVW